MKSIFIKFFLLLSLVSLVLAPIVSLAQDIPCYTKSDCEGSQKGVYEANSSCPAGKGYCYSKPPSVDLSVAIGGTKKVTNVIQYVQVLFKYLVGVAALVVTILIMVGGIQYLVGQTKEGMARIKNALIGLFILLASVTFLDTINPKLISLGGLKLPIVTKILVDGQRIVTCGKGGNAGMACDRDSECQAVNADCTCYQITDSAKQASKIILAASVGLILIPTGAPAVIVGVGGKLVTIAANIIGPAILYSAKISSTATAVGGAVAGKMIYDKAENLWESLGKTGICATGAKNLKIGEICKGTSDCAAGSTCAIGVLPELKQGLFGTDLGVCVDGSVGSLCETGGARLLQTGGSTFNDKDCKRGLKCISWKNDSKVCSDGGLNAPCGSELSCGSIGRAQLVCQKDLELCVESNSVSSQNGGIVDGGVCTSFEGRECASWGPNSGLVSNNDKNDNVCLRPVAGSPTGYCSDGSSGSPCFEGQDNWCDNKQCVVSSDAPSVTIPGVSRQYRIGNCQ